MLLAPLAAAHGQAAPAKPSSPPPARPARVITDLSGFRLDQSPRSSAPNQVGAASRGSATTIAICAPVAGYSATTRPTFTWKSSDSSLQLTFSLLNEAGDVLYEGSVAGNSFSYPADAPALSVGQTYSWKVSGGGMDKLPDPVSFTVKEKTVVESGDPLLDAQADLKSRLWYDAVAALVAGMHDQPGRADLAQQLAAMYHAVAPACSP